MSGVMLRRIVRPSIAAAPLLMAVALLAVLATVAAARSLTIESFDVQVRVERDGGIVVTETIRPHFEGEWNGLYRDVPVQYRTPQGFNKTLFVTMRSVVDESGNAYRVESSRERHYRRFKVWVPGARDVTKTIVLTYHVPNALLFFEDHDELYWNITGDEWEVPIQSATATIELPPAVTGVRTLAFTGAYGSRERDAEVAVDGSLVRLQMRRELGFREGLTAVVGWDKGFVQEPPRTAAAGRFLRSNWPLFLPLLVLLGMLRLWWVRGRDPRRLPVVVRYDPPEGLTPAEVGTLIDNRPDMRDITATLVDMAVRGHMTIEEKVQKKLLGMLSDTEYIFTRKQPPAGSAPLKPHETALMDGLFDGGERVSTDALENKFYRILPRIHDRLFEQLIAAKCYQRRPDRVRALYLVLAVVVFPLVMLLGAFLTRNMGMAPQAWVGAGILSAVVVAVFAVVMPARTTRGARLREQVLGFEEFLSRVDRERFERVAKTPELFEKMLPYAMCLGVEKRWVAAFDDICKEPPTWYHGGNMATFHAGSFARDMNRMTAATGAAMASSPRSSGSSGFSGGGSSGGGGGGGGGGGF